MTPARPGSEEPASAIDAATEQLLAAAALAKCRPCGCLRGAVRSIGRAFGKGDAPGRLSGALEAVRATFEEVRYDCLGCPVCLPARAVAALADAGVEVPPSCPAEEAAPREGWPPLPGDYAVLRYRAPVAIATLTDRSLARTLAAKAGPEVAIVGPLQTENLGIERVVANVVLNPHIRFLIICGEDSRQRVGHLPGASLLALARSGIDGRGRIVGAPGRRPVVRNAPPEAVEHFRRTVEVVDRIGCADVGALLDAARACAARDPGPAGPFAGAPAIPVIEGRLPDRTVEDPAGYFVAHIDRRRGQLVLEHYRNDGALDAVIEGTEAAALYAPAVERGLVTRLDHAAYLGRELACAEAALRDGADYVQDGAPERPEAAPPAPPTGCGCGASCGGEE